MEFEFDARNIRHLQAHGIAARLVREVGDLAPVLHDYSHAHLAGDFLMIGPDAGGRFWTIALLKLSANMYRPITGWPSTNRQIRLYKQMKEAQQ